MPKPIAINQTATTTYIPVDATKAPVIVTSYVISSTAAVTVQWKDSDGNALSGPMQIPVNGVIASGYCPDGQFETLQGKGVQLVQTGGGTVGGHFSYIQ